jgi:hypothetical protein
MSGSQTPADYVVQFGAVRSSSLLQEPDTDRNVAVLVSVEGAGVPGERGEVDDDAELFGSLGIVSRPLDPSTVAGRSLHAEVVCLRTADGLVPISARDLRLRMGGDGPGAGTIALVGYAGGFHSISPVDNDDMDKGAIQVVYCPYDYSGGVPTKALSIILDPTESAGGTDGRPCISIIHGEGQAILLQNDGSIRMQSPDGQSYVQVKNGKVSISADQIVLNGTIYVGNPTTAVALLPGATSQPCARLWINTP